MRYPSAAQRIGVQRPATPPTGTDPATEVFRQTAIKVDSTELLLVRGNALLAGDLVKLLYFGLDQLC